MWRQKKIRKRSENCYDFASYLYVANSLILAQFFIFLYRKKKPPARAITRHVVTRWYRGPEVILLQQKQETLAAVDMWSIGAIFGELLQMQRENRPDPTKRGPIFPGDSCFPLSIKDQMDYASRVDQMQMIFDVIGSPTEDEIAKITGTFL